MPPGRHRVKQLLELGNLGFMALMEAAYQEQEPSSGQANEGAVTPMLLAAADVHPLANPVAPPSRHQLV